MAEQLDNIMERASQALARMDYLTTETLCLEALAIARQERDWSYYARILLPLQEARRQRRMIAAEGVIRLGTAGLDSPPVTWLDQVQTGCVVLTRPHSADDARRLHERTREAKLHLEVLYAEAAEDDDPWTLRSYQGPAVRCPFAAPPAPWRGRWLPAGEVPGAGEARAAANAPATPADWFLDACEALGDAALESVDPGEAGETSVRVLEPMLEVAPDHEILHQRLGAAARAAGKGRG